MADKKSVNKYEDIKIIINSHYLFTLAFPSSHTLAGEDEIREGLKT
jgi:hypothetical protein